MFTAIRGIINSWQTMLKVTFSSYCHLINGKEWSFPWLLCPTVLPRHQGRKELYNYLLRHESSLLWGPRPVWLYKSSSRLKCKHALSRVPRVCYNYPSTKRRWRCSLHLALLSSSSPLWSFPPQPPPCSRPPPGPQGTTTTLHRFVNLCTIPSSPSSPRKSKGDKKKSMKICYGFEIIF